MQKQQTRDNAIQKKHPKAQICPELRGDISFKDGQKLVYCKGCKENYSYAGWAHHCGKHHPNAVRTADVKDDGTGSDESRRKPSAHGGKPKAGQRKDDEGSRSKPHPKAKAGAEKKPQPKAKAGAKKTECLRKGPAAKKKTSPKGS